ncbi:MAG: hypothetical protein ACKPI8_20110 [Microcystis panniformis]
MKSKILAIAALVTLAVFNCFPRISYSQPLLVSKEPTTPTLIVIDDDETAQLPVPVRSFLELYKAGNIDGAVDFWRDSVIKFISLHSDLSEKDQKDALNKINQQISMVKNILEVFNQQYGFCKDYTVLQEYTSVQDKYNIKSFLLRTRHEQISLFWRFTTIQTPKGTFLLSFQFSTDLREIIKDDK